jgi:hypothetical protein
LPQVGSSDEFDLFWTYLHLFSDKGAKYKLENFLIFLMWTIHFLLACHAASQLKDLPKEAMHLAGGLQFTRFSTVIATLLTIHDGDATNMADRVYQYLF